MKDAIFARILHTARYPIEKEKESWMAREEKCRIHAPDPNIVRLDKNRTGETTGKEIGKR